MSLNAGRWKGTARQVLVAAVGMGCAVGCTLSMPRARQTENLLPPPCLEVSRETALATPFFSEGEWPQSCWWEDFHDPCLNALIEQAYAYNPSLQEVQKRIEQMQQEAIVIRSPLFPLVFFDAQATRQYLSRYGLYHTLNPKLPLGANLIDLTLSFQYEFDFWGQNAHRFTAALGRLWAQEAEAAQVALITSTAVAQVYFALKTNRVRQYWYKALYAIQAGRDSLQRLLQAKSLASQLPTLERDEEVAEVEKLLAAIQDEINANEHALNILIGRSPDAPLCIDATLPPLPQTLVIPETLSCDLLARRPDLMAQIWRAKALAHEVGAAMADFFPDINILAFIGLESVYYPKLFQSGSKTAAVKPALHLPIFTAGAIAAQVGVQRAAFDAAVAAYNGLLLRSAQEVADVLSLGQTVFVQKEAQDRVVASARARYALTHLRRQKGLDNLLQEYAVEREWVLQELEDTVLLYNQYLAVVKLVKALGGGYCATSVPLQAPEVFACP